MNEYDYNDNQYLIILAATIQYLSFVDIYEVFYCFKQPQMSNWSGHTYQTQLGLVRETCMHRIKIVHTRQQYIFDVNMYNIVYRKQ